MKQQAALRFIQMAWQARGRGPTYEQIAERIGTRARSVAYRVVEELIQRGHVVKDTSARRPTIRPVGMDLPRTVTVNFQGDLYAALERYAEKTRTTPETAIREAVRAYVMGEG